MEVDEAARKEAWLSERRKHITGTDVAAILGLSRFKTPLRVWLEKKGEIEPDENEAMRWGMRSNWRGGGRAVRRNECTSKR